MRSISNEPGFLTLSSKLLPYYNRGQTDARYRTSAKLIDAISVNIPYKVLASGNIFFDISDQFSQVFCITTSAKDKLQQVKNIKVRDY